MNIGQEPRLVEIFDMLQCCTPNGLQALILCTIIALLLHQALLYGFIVPILPYMLENRLHLDPSRSQSYTSKLLTMNGLLQLFSAPITAHVSDKFGKKRVQLLVAILVGIMGTIFVATSTAVWALYLGRALQAIAASSAWIVGFATLTDATGPESQGTAMGVVLSFSACGMITGPTISGVLLKLVGYWLTWIVPIVVLFIDVVARLLMIEPSAEKDVSAHDCPANTQEVSDIDEESTTLLASRACSYQTIVPQVNPESSSEKHASNFYRTMLLDTGVLTGLASCVLYSTILTSFENTLPLHTRRVFGWDSLPTGIMFFCLQMPFIFLGPLCGWVRDRFGLRYPSVAGWAAMVPFLCLLGTPGNDSFPWAAAAGPAITISSLVTIGSFNTLVQGSGPMELSAAVRAYESTNPQVFGQKGAGSRVFALVETAFTLGLMLGPFISGSLVAVVGYFYMNVVLGILCAALSASSFFFLGKRNVAADQG
ncbi:MFS general substrate transporter [Cadophora sp. DSE1049]|nr:MFS general substrate transporter [Cadophora sp. DSE1049]